VFRAAVGVCGLSSAGASRCAGRAAGRGDFFHLSTVVEEAPWKIDRVEGCLGRCFGGASTPRVGGAQERVAGDFLTFAPYFAGTRLVFLGLFPRAIPSPSLIGPDFFFFLCVSVF